jgi:cytochrome c-type biogenesis protein
MEASNFGLSIAFLGGLASFLSPCVFALVPAYIGYLSGRSVGAQENNRFYTLSHGVAFVLGFSTIFILLGLGASAIGNLLYDLRPYLTRIGGVVVILFGLHMTGVITIPFLQYDVRRQDAPDKRYGYLSSFLLGVFFSAGWSPCVGPILGTILTLSLSTGSLTQGFWLLVAYSVGLAIPFLIAAVEIGLVTSFIKKYGNIVRYVEIAMGVVMIAIGALLFFGRFAQLASLPFFFDSESISEASIGTYILIILGLLIVLGLIPAFIARSKGRKFFDWWFFGAALIFVALPAALLIKPKEKAEKQPPPISGDEMELPAESQSP